MGNLRVVLLNRRVIAILLLVAAAMFFGVLERESVLVQDAMRKDSAVFRLPIPCTAIVSQRGAGEQWISRCYISSSDKGKQ